MSCYLWESPVLLFVDPIIPAAPRGCRTESTSFVSHVDPRKNRGRGEISLVTVTSRVYEAAIDPDVVVPLDGLVKFVGASHPQLGRAACHSETLLGRRSQVRGKIITILCLKNVSCDSKYTFIIMHGRYRPTRSTRPSPTRTRTRGFRFGFGRHP
jgi:hypothetical protein